MFTEKHIQANGFSRPLWRSDQWEIANAAGIALHPPSPHHSPAQSAIAHPPRQPLCSTAPNQILTPHSHPLCDLWSSTAAWQRDILISSRCVTPGITSYCSFTARRSEIKGISRVAVGQKGKAVPMLN
jgi:hypothetical protein